MGEAGRRGTGGMRGEREREEARKDSKSDLPSGKMLYRIRFLRRAAPAGNPILIGKCISRYRRDSSNIPLASGAARRTVLLNFLCYAEGDEYVYTSAFLTLFPISPRLTRRDSRARCLFLRLRGRVSSIRAQHNRSDIKNHRSFDQKMINK